MTEPDNCTIPRRGVTATHWALGIAIAWSAALVVSAFVAPFYSSSSTEVSSDGAVEMSSSTSTLVAVNGYSILIPVSIPLALAVICAWVLLRYRNKPTRTLGRLAWVLTASLALFTVLAILSIGVFILPVTIALVIACMTGAPMNTPRGSPFRR